MLTIWNRRSKVSRGKSKSHDICIRTCVVTGEERHQSELIRFVLDPAGTLVPDIHGKLPGRGLWVRATRENLTTAVSRNLFGRAARRRVDVPDNLVYMLETGLVERLMGLLALARKSGLAVAGFEKVRGEIGTQKITLLLHGSDGSERQLGKLLATARDLRRNGCLSSAELGRVFGREFVMYLGVRPGKLADVVSLTAMKLSVLRTGA